jgi:hypothetical protein
MVYGHGFPRSLHRDDILSEGRVVKVKPRWPFTWLSAVFRSGVILSSAGYATGTRAGETARLRAFSSYMA